jgi:hypothetical protein
MRLSTRQCAEIKAAIDILAVVLGSAADKAVLAERLEDAANLILNVSEELSLDIAASRQEKR